uniref:Uncharacterized protein n=1 Tax=Caloglossa beccarii TaxID=131038 RepID=A0A1Z1M8H6_9FLOR|nr:hypothetical protein [Caloglossa beccarii]ARW62270.1 hypothetical protein [Caloglossa beccarii]
MNLSYLSFYSQYLKSPTTILHKIEINYKILITYTILFFLPYCHYIYLLILTLFIVYINFYILKKKAHVNILLTINKSIIYSIILFYYLHSLQYSNKILFNYIKYIRINFLTTYFLYKNKHAYFIIKQYFQYNIPTIFFKTLLVTLLYIQSIKILNLSTRYESIILNFKKLLNRINLYKQTQNSYFFLIILFTAKFLERIIYKPYILYLSIKIKYSYFINPNSFFYITRIMLYKYIISIYYDTHIFAYNLWNKQMAITYYFY